MMLSEFFYQGHNLDESLAFLWVGYGSSDVNPSQEETYVSENDEDDSNFGDALLLGVSSQRVYYWKSLFQSNWRFQLLRKKAFPFHEQKMLTVWQ